jgi:chromosome segregation ATPase
MFKKLVVTAIAIGAGFFLLRSTHLGGYAKTAFKKARESVQGQIPIEFQLESIRNEVAQLVPDMKDHISKIAAETVAIDGLREEVVDIRGKLDGQKDLVSAMKNELLNGKNHTVAFRGHSYATERFQEKFQIALLGAKQCSENLKAKEQLLEAKERGLEAAKSQLASMRTQKSTLEVQIAQLEAELKTMRLAQVKSEFQLDDSRLAHIKASIAEVKNRMKVIQKTATLVGEFGDEFKDSSEPKIKSKAELVKEAQDFLGGNGEVVSAAKEKHEEN